MLETEGRFWNAHPFEDMVLRELIEHGHRLGPFAQLAGGYHLRACDVYDGPSTCFGDFNRSVFGHRHRKRAEVFPSMATKRSLLKKDVMFLRLFHNAHHRG